MSNYLKSIFADVQFIQEFTTGVAYNIKAKIAMPMSIRVGPS